MLGTAGEWGAAIAAQLPPSLDPTLGTRETWSYIAYALTAFTGLIFLFTLIMLRRVAVAVACIKASEGWSGEVVGVLRQEECLFGGGEGGRPKSRCRPLMAPIVLLMQRPPSCPAGCQPGGGLHALHPVLPPAALRV